MPINPMILEQIRSNDPSLTSLSLVGYRIAAKAAKVLAKALKDNTTLTNLDLSHSQISIKGVRALAKALKANTTLTNLNLRYNHIGVEGAKELADALKVNTALTNLNLTANKISNKGVKALANALKVNTSLTSLDLSINHIGTKGAKALANALKVNTALVALNLGNSEIGFKGAKALAEALKVNATLSFLELSYNQILNEGVDALKVALKENITLKTLSLTRISKSSFAIIDKFGSIHRNMNITFLLKDYIKAAWVNPIARYSLQDHQSALSKMNLIFRNVNHVNVSESYEKLIESIFELRLSDDKSEIELTEAVFENLMGYISSLSLDFETLANRTYPKEFVRFLVARVNAKNMGDAEAQAIALAGLTQPFNDSDLRKETATLLMGILNNVYFAKLLECSVQRRALDLLTLDLACQHPRERDLMYFALTSYARLIGEKKPSREESFHKLDQSDLIIVDFENFLKMECEPNNLTRALLREKCLEELTLGLVLLPSVAPTPNIHQFFTPPTAPTEAPSNKKPQPRRRRT